MLKPRPYESGDPVAEYNEAITGDTAEAFGVTDVVPVIVTDPVTVAPEPARTFHTATHTLGAVAERIVNDVPTRRRLVLAVTGGAAGDYALLGRTQAVSPSTGYRLTTGDTLTLTAAGEVWASAGAGVGLAVSVLAEYSDGS